MRTLFAIGAILCLAGFADAQCKSASAPQRAQVRVYAMPMAGYSAQRTTMTRTTQTSSVSYGSVSASGGGRHLFQGKFRDRIRKIFHRS